MTRTKIRTKAETPDDRDDRAPGETGRDATPFGPGERTDERPSSTGDDRRRDAATRIARTVGFARQTD